MRSTTVPAGATRPGPRPALRKALAARQRSYRFFVDAGQLDRIGMVKQGLPATMLTALADDIHGHRGRPGTGDQPGRADAERGLRLSETTAFWRIAADTPSYEATDLSGKGPETSGGRWNRGGTPLLYASGSRALACLETLVHPGNSLPLNRYLVELTVPAAALQAAVTFDAAWWPGCLRWWCRKNGTC